jgi:micrococcal nuclease
MKCLRHAIAIALLALSGTAVAADFSGVVTYVTDGDTVWVRSTPSAEAVAVRLHGIDAPEVCQAHGREARAALASQVLHRQVQVASRAQDSYDRVLGRVTLDGRDVASWMVSEGHAWSDAFRRRAGPYAQQQERAQKARIGLWAEDTAMRPREFRKRHGSCR